MINVYRLNAVEFFYKHAGLAYQPGKETPEEGRMRGAGELAAAETWALDNGYVFDWGTDDEYSLIDSEGENVPSYRCTMLDEGGKHVQALYGCDFGSAGPFGPYRRLVEAELALEQQKATEKLP